MNMASLVDIFHYSNIAFTLLHGQTHRQTGGDNTPSPDVGRGGKNLAPEKKSAKSDSFSLNHAQLVLA